MVSNSNLPSLLARESFQNYARNSRFGKYVCICAYVCLRLTCGGVLRKHLFNEFNGKAFFVKRELKF